MLKHFERTRYVVGFVVVTVAMYSLTARIARPTARVTRPAAELASFQGRQVLVILVGSSSCRFTSDPRARIAFWKIVRAERTRGSDSVAVSTVGIAIDRSAGAGMETLKAIGEFDEYSVGNGWLSVAALHFIVRDLSGVAMVPQVLVVSRNVSSGSPPGVGEDSIHVRLAGVEEIERWANRLEAVPKGM